jgi:hypothetical protein
MNFNALRFTIPNLLLLVNILLLSTGGIALWAGFAVLLLLTTLMDEALGDSREEETRAPTLFLDGMIYLALPLYAINTLLCVAYFSPAEHTWLGGALSYIGMDFDAARNRTSALDSVGALLTLGVLYGYAINIGHELVHRTWSPVASTCGRWLTAMSLDSEFSLQHLNGHHTIGGTFEDPSTSHRGETLYGFIVRATIGTMRFAVSHEAERLNRKGLPFWSRHNRFLTGQAMTLAVASACYCVGGWMGLAAYVALGLQGRFYLEAAGYVEHYGLLRVPGTRFEARHSWNSYRSLSNGILYNLARHADHHANAGKPYYRLHMNADAPELPYGYMTMFALAMVPPLFDYVMRPHLATWDSHFATEAERRYIAENGGEVWAPAAAE